MSASDSCGILLAFYGDDFTGSTATAEALAEYGVATVLFTQPPSATFLAQHFPGLQAVGIAGTARTMAVDQLPQALEPVFTTAAEYGAPLFLYKVCSTFDSSETVGSIGRAIEIAQEILHPELIPLLPAAPRLGRYTVFGHHFAALGQECVYRLDRHPSVARHPVTPMAEADLRLHLAHQTKLACGLIDLLTMRQGRAALNDRIEQLVAEGKPLFLFDCLYEEHLTLACETVWQHAKNGKYPFFVGSQEVGHGLAQLWQKEGLIVPPRASSQKSVSPASSPILVLSGSCATVTARQIDWAVKNGFCELVAEPRKLIDESSRPAEIERIVRGCVAALAQGQSTVVHTAVGPDDARIASTKRRTVQLELTDEAGNEAIGGALGEIALRTVQECSVRRLVLCGGDTAGNVQSRLGVRAVQVAKAIGAAAPLCYIYSSISTAHGLEVAFKGGQIGAVDYFGQVRAAEVPVFEAAALGSFSSVT